MFVVNLPPRKVWVRNEYLYDLRKGHGQYTLGYWVSLKSIWGRSFYFETYLPEYGAVYDKLPISAFIDWDPDSPLGPDPDEFICDDFTLSDLQYWDSFDYDVEVIPKQFLYSMSVTVRHRSGKTTTGGKYIFTLDSCHRDLDRPDLSYSETPEEHKSHNCIVLPNGQIGLYPNNRCQWVDESLTPAELKRPDFLVSTRRFTTETGGVNGTLGDSEEYFWETPEEKDAFDHVEQMSIEKEIQDRRESVIKNGPFFAGNYQGPLYSPHPDLE
jgi:hypothetical protein